MSIGICLIPQTAESRQLPQAVRYTAVGITIVLLFQIFRLGPKFSQIQYYGILTLMNLVALFQCTREGLKVVGVMLIFYLLMWFSILFNFWDIPPQYQSSLRTIAFGGTLLATGPFFQNELLLAFRRYLLQWMNLGLCIMAMLSFAGYILHFFPTDHQGYYLGCTFHSMILGAIAGLSGINLLHELTRPNISSRRQKLFICMYLGCVVCALVAASRVCVGSLGCASLAYAALAYRGRIIGALKLLLTIAVIGLIILQFTGNVSTAISSKMTASSKLQNTYDDEEEDFTLKNLTASRKGKWEDRLNEISHAPFFGVGAHSMRREWCENEEFSSDGQIEPGNGWLYVFSSMGIFAFICFCILFIKPICRFWQNARPGSDACLLFGQLVFFAVYMNAESHITAAGDFTCLYGWLLVAVSHYPNLSTLNQRTLQLLPIWDKR